MRKQGAFLGIPYDWRWPSWKIIKEKMWNKENRRIFTPKLLGWGWGINFYELFRDKKRLFIIVAILVLLLVSGYILFPISKSRTFQFFGGITHRVNTKEKVIALTFDDAPTKYSNEVVDILNKKGIKATFYAIGQNIEHIQLKPNILLKTAMISEIIHIHTSDSCLNHYHLLNQKYKKPTI